MVLFPTLAVCVEHFMKENPERTYLNVRAFNRWLDEDWGFGTGGRIYGVPLMSLLDVDAAVAELEWVLDRGARFIHLRPGPQGGHNPADPIFDPFWERVNEAAHNVAFHISESGYNEFLRRPAHHADDLRTHVHELLRPLPADPRDVDRERLAVGALPARGDGQDEGDGS